MSIYSKVTEQDLINLRKLSDQQKKQRALKIKNRILKQTHDIKLAENLSPVTKKLDKVNESIQKLGEIVKKSNTPRPAIENTHNELPLENEQIDPGVIYDTSLEKTLNNMKKKLLVSLKKKKATIVIIFGLNFQLKKREVTNLKF